MLRELSSVHEALNWLAGHGVAGLTTDSRKVRPGCAFIAWPGQVQDGRRYVAAALAAGAAACLVEADGAEAFEFGDERIATLCGLKASTGPLASEFFGKPSERLKVIATTGTNGKTSTAWWVAQAMSSLGQRCGVIGTLGVGEPPSASGEGRIASTGLTTPDPVTLQAALEDFADTGFAACALEASSIGIVEHRLAGTRIDVALFTNFTQDHLDYHGSMQAYRQAKAELFEWPGLSAAVINIDDATGAELVRSMPAGGAEVWTYSAQQNARLVARRVGYIGGGLAFDVQESSDTATVRSRLIGDYNVCNLLAVIGALRALGVTLADATDACARLTPVPGRMQRVIMQGDSKGAASPAQGLPEVVVDYAHTPDALDKSLRALQPLARQRGGVLWCVFGCGGNRDATKRPLMGALAQQLAQHAVVTSDNPRNESPARILQDIVAGMTGTPEPIVIEDRRAAIAQALSLADARDVILIAGKGHEDYQEIAGVKHPFSDVEEAMALLVLRQGAAQ